MTINLNSPEGIEDEKVLSERESLEFELEQAREDDRDAWSRTWQAIVAGITAVAIIMAMYSGVRPNDAKNPANWPIPPESFLALMLLVTVASYSYVTSTAVVSSLRYRYIRDIESRLMELSNDRVMRWKLLSSSIETYNVNHISSVYAVDFYVNVALAVLATTGFLGVTVFIFIRDMPNSVVAQVMLTAFLLLAALFISTVVIQSMHSLEMYDFAKRNMRDRIEQEREGKRYEAKSDARHAGWAILYYLYPRPMDAAKFLYVVLGVVLGIAVSGFTIDAPGLLLKVFFVFLVFDVLVYQTRYQWNDIRGAYEDDNNPKSDRRARLPKDIIGLRPAILLSVLFGVFKLALAAELIVWPGSMLGEYFMGICVFVFVFGALYEFARAKECVPAVVFLVTLGYPLRVAAGMSVGLMTAAKTFSDVSLPLLLVVLLASAAFGLSFVGITWALEGCDYVQSKRKDGCSLNKAMDYKKHVIWMYKQIGDASRDEYPLQPRGKILTAWNVGIVASQALLSAYVLQENLMNPYVAAVCFAYFGILVYGVLSNHKRTTGKVLCTTITIALLVTLPFGRVGILGDAVSVVTLITVGVYLDVYLMFRAMNYEEMTNTLQSILQFFKCLGLLIQKLILGNRTAEAIQKAKHHEESKAGSA